MIGSCLSVLRWIYIHLFKTSAPRTHVVFLPRPVCLVAGWLLTPCPLLGWVQLGDLSTILSQGDCHPLARLPHVKRLAP